jgi:hydroxyacylglutathione hydrolase
MLLIETIETTSLGDRSYLATDGRVAVVIDPQRDIDRILAVLDKHGVELTHVCETHVHNDYVTGGFELAARLGVEYVLPAGDEVSFYRRRLADGDVISSGGLRLRAMYTPGHTDHHLSYVLADADADFTPQAVFTGGSLLYGSTGRTDLVSPDITDELTRAQFSSVHRLADELPAETLVCPTHGFGSFCAATQSGDEESTIGQESRQNPALTMNEREYADTLLAGVVDYPAYYSRTAPINRQGPGWVDLSLPARVDGAELRRRIDAGEWVVDLRERTAFAAGHLAGSLSFELSTDFVTYLGWLYRWDTPLTLVGESEQQVAAARRELVRIGVDALAGMAVGDVADLAADTPAGANAGLELRSYRVADFAALARARSAREVQVVDARRDDERATGAVAGSVGVPLHELRERMDEIPQGEVWIHCGSGYRAAIAASILDQPGRRVVLVNDRYEAAKEAGLEA